MLDSSARVTVALVDSESLGSMDFSFPHLSQSSPANGISEAVIWLTIIKYDGPLCVHKDVDRQIAFRCQCYVALNMTGPPPGAACARFVCGHVPLKTIGFHSFKGS